MTVTERVAYLKGLFEGLGISTEEKEGKLLKGMLEAMEALAESVTDLEQRNADLLDELDEVYEELSALEDELIDEDKDLDSEELDFDPDEDLYQVICPTCEESIFIDEGTLAEGSIQCPACGEELEFDLSGLEEDEAAEDKEEE
ncbi:hypothetical protein LI291_00010 [Intestinibacillus massiliensis]|nr:hypothetical protein [Intestinibacillus massiliensis]